MTGHNPLGKRSLPDHCPYCGRSLAVKQEWWLGRIRRSLECPRYTAWWMLLLGRASRHFMTVLDPWERTDAQEEPRG